MTAGITFDGVWKKFNRGERHDSLRDLIPAFARRSLRRARPEELGAEEFWAVRDVSFDVGPGDALGIIGPNGAGKSTILKLLSRILAPTKGRCEVRGRAGALIEIAAGFHPDLTGRENVFLQGAIMGMPQSHIATRFDRIVEFAGVGEFIDTPVKRYSSGMNARLGFAIAAHLEPEVLIIDEVLSVGDAAFQEQCIERMRELAASGVPLIFVSHNLPAVIDLCTRALLIARGSVLFDGRPAEAISEYRRAAGSRALTVSRKGEPMRITSVRVLDGTGRDTVSLRTGGSMRIRIGYQADHPIASPHFAVDILGDDGTYCAGIHSRFDRWDAGVVHGAGSVDLVISQLALLRGSYVLSAGIHDSQGARPYDLQHRIYPFSVTSECRDLGLVALEHAWAHGPAVPAADLSREEAAS